MGCDIHLYFEKKVRGKWVPFTDIPEKEYPDGRSYDVFALLAGVRGYYPKNYFGGRGIPEDTSYVAPTDDEDDDDLTTKPWIGDHSFTYATIFELKKVKWERYMDYEPHFARFIKTYFPLDTANDKNIRIIMGFDS
jgi:hypothetical protein